MAPQKIIRCAVYTRKSTEHNLDLEFNSLDAQRESCEAYIKSQMHEGWRLVPDRYDDGGISGGSLDRPDLQRLLGDIRARRVDNVVVYKVDRLTRSLTDFAKLVELFDAHGVSFVSVTQAFNTTNSMGRLKTFAREGEGYLLCIKLDGASIDAAWLIPANELEGVARQSSTHLIVVASAKATSKDRFSHYRAKTFGEVSARMFNPRTE
jgi:hypothetical protein